MNANVMAELLTPELPSRVALALRIIELRQLASADSLSAPSDDADELLSTANTVLLQYLRSHPNPTETTPMGQAVDIYSGHYSGDYSGHYSRQHDGPKVASGGGKPLPDDHVLTHLLKRCMERGHRAIVLHPEVIVAISRAVCDLMQAHYRLLTCVNHVQLVADSSLPIPTPQQLAQLPQTLDAFARFA